MAQRSVLEVTMSEIDILISILFDIPINSQNIGLLWHCKRWSRIIFSLDGFIFST